MKILKKKKDICSRCFQVVKPYKPKKLAGRYKMVTDLGDLLVHKRLIIDNDWEKFMTKVISGKYEKRQYLFKK
jgi:hypothetical protein